jgi:hypothetical protein
MGPILLNKQVIITNTSDYYYNKIGNLTLQEGIETVWINGCSKNHLTKDDYAEFTYPNEELIIKRLHHIFDNSTSNKKLVSGLDLWAKNFIKNWLIECYNKNGLEIIAYSNRLFIDNISYKPSNWANICEATLVIGLREGLLDGSYTVKNYRINKDK